MTLGYSTAYYPQGNGLAESSNKSLVNIIKELLEDNKKTWNKRLVNALWADRLTTKKSIGTSPYQLVDGMDDVFPYSLGVPIMKMIQEMQVEPNEIQRRINQTIHLLQTREEVYIKSQVIQEKIKKIFDKKTKEEYFFIGDQALKWDSTREEKGKHGKFEFLWKGPYVIYGYRGNNASFLKELDGTNLQSGPVNGQMLKHYFSPNNQWFICFILPNVNTIAKFRLEWMIIW